MEFRNAETLLLKLNISRFYNGWRYHAFLFLSFFFYLFIHNKHKVPLVALLYLYDTSNSILYMTNNKYRLFS